MIDTVLHKLYDELYVVTRRMDVDFRQLLYLNRKIKERRERLRKQRQQRALLIKIDAKARKRLGLAQRLLEQDEMDEVIRDCGG